MGWGLRHAVPQEHETVVVEGPHEEGVDGGPADGGRGGAFVDGEDALRGDGVRMGEFGMDECGMGEFGMDEIRVGHIRFGVGWEMGDEICVPRFGWFS